MRQQFFGIKKVALVICVIVALQCFLIAIDKLLLESNNDLHPHHNINAVNARVNVKKHPFEASLNLNDFPRLISSNLQGVLMNVYNYKYSYYDSNDIPVLSLFENCQVGHWSKNSQEHYFVQQLNNNDHQRRVYNCMDADIFVIPVSFGNAARSRCGPSMDNSTVIRQIASEIGRFIFNNSKSCWNVNLHSRQTHLLISGGYTGILSIPLIWKQQFIIADTVSYKYNHTRRCITHSHTPLVSSFAGGISTRDVHELPTNVRMDVFYDNSNAIYHLPEVQITNLIAFKHRKYLLFFMGLANLKHSGYKLRRIWCQYVSDNYEHDRALQGNVAIQTYGDALFDRNCNLTHLTFPCHLQLSNQSLFIELMSDSKFSLMFRGADPCSARFYDAISLNVINIVISDEFKTCLFGYESTIIPWQKMFLWLSEKEFQQNPKESIYKLIAQYTEQDFEAMLLCIEKWKPHILWDIHNSQTAHSLLYSALLKYGPTSFRQRQHVHLYGANGTAIK